MGNLISLKFWFKMRPGELMPIYHKALIVIILILGIAAIVLTLFNKRSRKNPYARFLKKLGGFCLTNCILGVILLFFTYEMIPLLSSRFWFLIWGMEIIIWLIFIFKILLEMPKKKEERQKEEMYKKYIP